MYLYIITKLFSLWTRSWLAAQHPVFRFGLRLCSNKLINWEALNFFVVPATPHLIRHLFNSQWWTSSAARAPTSHSSDSRTDQSARSKPEQGVSQNQSWPMALPIGDVIGLGSCRQARTTILIIIDRSIDGFFNSTQHLMNWFVSVCLGMVDMKNVESTTLL